MTVVINIAATFVNYYNIKRGTSQNTVTFILAAVRILSIMMNVQEIGWKCER
jgi:hypothetical protein